MQLSKREKLAVLKLAREKIGAPYGWVKRRFRSETYSPSKHGWVESYCIGAACQVAAHELFPKRTMNEGTHSTVIADRISLKQAVIAKGYPDVVKFNDHPKTKKKDVLALMDSRIAELEAELGPKKEE